MLARLDKFQSDSKGDPSILLKRKSPQNIRTLVFAEGTMPPSKIESNFEVEISFIHCDINCTPRIIGFNERENVVSDQTNSK